MKAIYHTVIKNDYTYDGVRKELSEDGYKRLYQKKHYLFGINIHTHNLDEKVTVKEIDKNGMGFGK